MERDGHIPTHNSTFQERERAHEKQRRRHTRSMLRPLLLLTLSAHAMANENSTEFTQPAAIGLVAVGILLMVLVCAGYE